MSAAAALPEGLAAALAVLEQAAPIAALRNSTYVYPLVNAAHIVGIALLFGGIVPLDLRLAGWRRRGVAVDGLAGLLVPVAIFGLVLAALSGVLLFATDASNYAASPLFRAKLVLIALALANVVLLRRTDWRGESGPTRRVALAGIASLSLWLGAIVLGRMIGYF